ncbi:MAG: helix-hairpin-helix domain-containing protein, partial [Deferribacterota bacterium]|nr:helix-hairpin-helix domain-containing protein [Deferribacterota bacterium]
IFLIFIFFITVAIAKIDLNSATKKQLMSLDGIGEVKAEAIIEYRERYGKIYSIEELININGIGKKTIENIKGDVLLE